MARIRAEIGMRVVHNGREATILATARDYDNQDYASYAKLRFDAWWQPTRWVYCGGSVYQIDDVTTGVQNR